MAHTFKSGDKLRLRKDIDLAQLDLEEVRATKGDRNRVFTVDSVRGGCNWVILVDGEGWFCRASIFELATDEAPAESNWTVNNEWPWYPDAHIMD